ncbi:MAG: urease accessory protein [Mariprofundaceae bacterium]|nr:urease accessory protein [Mariprofundaceae bacterium]
MLSVLLLGFLLGMRHAVEADHVAAVASMSTQTNSLKEAMKLGATWGLGHTLTLFLFGSIVIFSTSVIPDTLALSLEFVVGIMLVFLGMDVIRRMRKERIHFHLHKHHDGITHFHAHAHPDEGAHTASAHNHAHKKGFHMRSLFVGMMHGMAGSAALIILTLQTVETPLMGLVYIALFGFGSVVGMAALATMIIVPLRHSSKKITRFYYSFQASIGIGTIALGMFVMYEVGFVEGLVL